MADTILHNQPEGTPSDNELIAYGTPTTPAGNIKLSNFYNLLMGKLGFFKVSNLFSEIFGNPTSMASARGNLEVYSKSEVLNQVSARALKTNVIEKDSTVAYTPTIGTHPVNLKVITDKFPASGTVQWPGEIGPTSGNLIVNIGKTLPNNNYSVLLTAREGMNIGIVQPEVYGKTTTTFVLNTLSPSGAGGIPSWDWIIIMN